MATQLSTEQITKKVEDKDKEKAAGIAQAMMERFGIQVPKVPMCFICGEQIMGQFIEYFDKDRKKHNICMPCIFISVDFYLEKGMK